MSVTFESIYKEEPTETPAPQPPSKPKLDEKDISYVGKNNE